MYKKKEIAVKNKQLNKLSFSLIPHKGEIGSYLINKINNIITTSVDNNTCTSNIYNETPPGTPPGTPLGTLYQESILNKPPDSPIYNATSPPYAPTSPTNNNNDTLCSYKEESPVLDYSIDSPIYNEHSPPYIAISLSDTLSNINNKTTDDNIKNKHTQETDDSGIDYIFINNGPFKTDHIRTLSCMRQLELLNGIDVDDTDNTSDTISKWCDIVQDKSNIAKCIGKPDIIDNNNDDDICLMHPSYITNHINTECGDVDPNNIEVYSSGHLL